MKLVKKILLALLAIVATASLAACSSSAKSTNTWTKAEKTKSITIGFDDTFVPMGFKAKNGKYEGFDIDLATAVFKKYGIKIKWQPINWSMKEAELKKGDIDLIWNGYSITKAREKLVLFSKPYMPGQQELITKKSSHITKVSDMKGKTVGVQAGSSGYSDFTGQPKLLEDLVSGKTISQYSNFEQAFLDLKDGRIDGLLVDQTYGDYYLTQNKLQDKYNSFVINYTNEPTAVGARKSDKELIAKINAGIAALHKSGEFQKISEKWFGKDVYPTN